LPRPRVTTRADERAAHVRFAEDELWVTLMDGRTISVPLAWYPKLLHATKKQRKNWETCTAGYGIHQPVNIRLGYVAISCFCSESAPQKRLLEEWVNDSHAGDVLSVLQVLA
jgi:hypothetical protein